MTNAPQGRSSAITVLLIFGIAILVFGATLYYTWQMVGPGSPGPASIEPTAVQS
ncbi:MAG: hypothetical protein Q4G35_04720 [Propionibacteriaceae bacterium]|nr:hypothetical protein [Propionibacteriaceae bacterium]